MSRRSPVQDWSGSGSGSAFIQAGDGDTLVTALPLNINTILCLKQNSGHVVTGRTSPFPSFPLFEGSGCIGKNAAVVADGMAYWITPKAKMAMSDGSGLFDAKDVPALRNCDDLLASLDRLSNIQMTRQQGSDFDWLVISGNKDHATQNDFAIIWDLNNKCWVQCSTGYGANSFGTTSDGVLYMGGYDGYVYEMDVDNVRADASNSDTAVTWYVDTDWLSRTGSLKNVTQVAGVNVAYQGRETGTLTGTYGYDFVEPLSGSFSFSILGTGAIWSVSLWGVGVWGTLAGKIANPRLLGRGNVFKMRLSGSSLTQYNIYKFTLFGKDNAQKNFGAR
jgi:hypothetical protein